eukprot:1154350-Pelagomonas_calceolata.AAC.1
MSVPWNWLSAGQSPGVLGLLGYARQTEKNSFEVKLEAVKKGVLISSLSAGEGRNGSSTMLGAVLTCKSSSAEAKGVCYQTKPS